VTKILLNTLYVGTQHTVVRLENDQVRVELEGEKLLMTPLHQLGSIVLFGLVHPTVPLMTRCAEDGRAFVFMSEYGRFRARIQGKTSGNVLLRQAQYQTFDEEGKSLPYVQAVVAGKVQNQRQVLLRGAREQTGNEAEALAYAAEALARHLILLATAQNTNEVRGIEGIAAQDYFAVFDHLIRIQRTDFRFDGRSRRPPRDRTNCLLSFLYSLFTNDCVSALEGVGLDPQYGCLHMLRPGRPSLALDVVEEFRALILDRLCLSLINRKQMTASDFEIRDGGSVSLTADGRKKLLVAYQKRKMEEVRHPLFKEKVPIGLLLHVQARILARALRGDIPHYIPYTI
jgi:CRISPR-associated protein Cas1